ncbi:MAG: type II toxin-antitoxin system RelE/ParE family toxin [Planctomycetota bacterium]|nr:type II toxin-antitoxin system RelE/ParE family toxin [Planctomycetota bacterium]MDA1252087.1 type II toxin-antitoxin system RelE/ParE family toxin [Planctomycetota bacterium]
MAEVKWTSPAQSDLASILDFLVERNVSAARRFTETLDQKSQLYAGQPEMGSLYPGLDGDARFFLVQPYVVFYRPLPDGIVILRIIYGTRDIPSHLS